MREGKCLSRGARIDWGGLYKTTYRLVMIHAGGLGSQPSLDLSACTCMAGRAAAGQQADILPHS